MDPARLKVTAPAIWPPQEGAVEPEATEISVTAFVEVTVPPLPTQAVRLGDMTSPIICELPFRSRVAPGPTATMELFVDPWAPCQSVLSPAFSRTVPPRILNALVEVLKYCAVLKTTVPPRPTVTLAELEIEAVTVRSAPEATNSAASVEPKARTVGDPAAASVALPMDCEAPVASRLPLERVSWLPPEVAKITSVPAPSIFSALIVRLLRPGLLETAVSAVIL